MSNTLHFALEYYDRGWSIIPLVGKRPPNGFRWKEFQSQRAKLDDIKRWFGSSKRNLRNIGIVTGDVSGIIVVDCDTPADAVWWSKNFPVSPLAANTGRGGAHFYYRANPSDPISNRANVLGKRIDIRGDGGYVCAPPSVHPVTDVTYEWQPWNHYSFDEIPMFDPAWLGPSHQLASSVTTASAGHPRRMLIPQPDSVRPVNEIYRECPRPQRVQRLVAKLSRNKRDRSKRDYAIVCELIRMGIRQADIWSLVHEQSKFATNGWGYFITTFCNASRAVANSTE